MDPSQVERIYHIVPRSQFRIVRSAWYESATLTCEGFIHCSTDDQVLRVANEVFSETAEPLLLLRIETAKLGSRVLFEPAAPVAGGRSPGEAERFPHVYGPIELHAVSGVGLLGSEGGRFVWPSQFIPAADYIG